ncbi:MAG: DNRLRE domain-containing protein [Pseudomonadota bacterium]
MKRKQPPSLLASVAFLMLGLVTGTAYAVPAPLTQDTHVRANSTGTNYSNSPQLMVYENAPRHALVQFDTTGFMGTVTTADLMLLVDQLPRTGELEVRRLLAPFDETTVNFNTQPPFDAMVDGTRTVIPADVGQVITVDITPAVQAWLDDPSSNHGLIIFGVNDLRVKFASSRSGSGGPSLNVVAAVMPAPNDIVIANVNADLDTDTLTITGENFDNGAAPTVNLSMIGDLTVTSSNATQIIATLPAVIPDGDYLLTVTTGMDDGQSGTFDLTIGATGEQGPQGKMGPPGADGAVGAQGPQGKIGATGNTGAQGPQGKIGATGNTGAQGPQGKIGATGATGDDGAQGPQGKIGATGMTGAPGPQGVAGATGATGAMGPQGPQGKVGPVGPAGPPGSGGGVPTLPLPAGGNPPIITVPNDANADTPHAVTITSRVHFARVVNEDPGQDADICRIDAPGITLRDGMIVQFITDRDPDPSSPSGGDGWRFQNYSDTVDCVGISNPNIIGSPLLNDIDESAFCTFGSNIIRDGSSTRAGWVCR